MNDGIDDRLERLAALGCADQRLQNRGKELRAGQSQPARTQGL
jgi:hypothetical protein